MLYRLTGFRPKSYETFTKRGMKTFRYREFVIGAIPAKSQAEAVAKFCEQMEVIPDTVKVRNDDRERQQAFDAFGL